MWCTRHVERINWIEKKANKGILRTVKNKNVYLLMRLKQNEIGND